MDFSKQSIILQSDGDVEILRAGVLSKPTPAETWQWDFLAHIFHYGTCHPGPMTHGVSENTSSLEHAISYAKFCESIASEAPPVEIIKGGRVIILPPPVLDDFRSTSLLTALQSRKTCRDFDGKAVSLQKISDLLFCTFGEQVRVEPDEPKNIKTYGYRRTSPLAGSLHCTEPYLWSINIEGLAPGIYHYLSRRHQLEIVTDRLPLANLGTFLCHQDWANEMAFAVIMTVRFDKLWWKYPHSRAYRPALMDVGHLSQTLNLAITAAGLQPWLTGYFHDKELSDVLACESSVGHPMILVGGGTGSGSSYDKNFRLLAEMQEEF